MTDPAINADRFDKLVAPRAGPSRLWGAETIARYLGVSPDSVRAWAREPDVPIYQPRPRTYFAERADLDEWLKRKPATA